MTDTNRLHKPSFVTLVFDVLLFTSKFQNKIKINCFTLKHKGNRIVSSTPQFKLYLLTKFVSSGKVTCNINSSCPDRQTLHSNPLVSFHIVDALCNITLLKHRNRQGRSFVWCETVGLYYVCLIVWSFSFIDQFALQITNVDSNLEASDFWSVVKETFSDINDVNFSWASNSPETLCSQ